MCHFLTNEQFECKFIIKTLLDYFDRTWQQKPLLTTDPIKNVTIAGPYYAQNDSQPLQYIYVSQC